MAQTASQTAAKALPAGLMVSAQTHAVDHESNHWMAFLYESTGDGTGVVRLGNFNPMRVMGVVTDKEDVLPVQLSPGSWPNTNSVSVKFDQPWPRGQSKRFGLLATNDSIAAGDNGEGKLSFDNTPGPNCIQQFILIANKSWGLQSSSEEPATKVTSGDFTVYVWQKHVVRNEGYRVDVTLQEKPEAL